MVSSRPARADEALLPDQFELGLARPGFKITPLFVMEMRCNFQLLHENLLDGRTEDDYVRDAERIGPYLTLMGGRLYEQLEIDWCEAVLEALTARARSAQPGTEPAPA